LFRLEDNSWSILRAGIEYRMTHAEALDMASQYAEVICYVPVEIIMPVREAAEPIRGKLSYNYNNLILIL
jgi:hypothetical protein